MNLQCKLKREYNKQTKKCSKMEKRKNISTLCEILRKRRSKEPICMTINIESTKWELASLANLKFQLHERDRRNDISTIFPSTKCIIVITISITTFYIYSAFGSFWIYYFFYLFILFFFIHLLMRGNTFVFCFPSYIRAYNLCSCNQIASNTNFPARKCEHLFQIV